MKQSLIRTVPIFLGFAAIVACGSDSIAPPDRSVTGAYTATTLRATGSFGQVNLLQAGSTLTLNLASGGTLSGHLHLAATSANPEFDADMAGTWAQIGSTIKLTQGADTFVRNVDFDIEPNVDHWDLVGSLTTDGTQINVTLSQQPVCPAC